MRSLWVLLLVLPLAGCTDDGDGIFDQLFGPSETLDGVCGHVFNDAWDQQIILQVRLDENASEIVDVTDVVLSASHHDGDELRGYDRDRRPDEQGCVSFPLKGEGGYFFLGLAFREGSSQCYAKGQLGGTMSDDFEVAQGLITMQRRGRC